MARRRGTRAIDPDELEALTVTTLRSWRVEIPGRSTLERHISNATGHGPGRLWQHFLARLPSDFRDAIDRLLTVADGERHSALFQFKQYPPEATPAVLLEYLDRFELLRSLGVERIDVSNLNTEIVKQLADLGYRYPATTYAALRRRSGTRWSRAFSSRRRRPRSITSSR